MVGSLQTGPQREERLMETSGVEVVRGVYEAFGRGNVPAVLAAMTDETHA
jgi:hypothetical protein